ncbi:MAG: M18 family aminopeptidase [bacterium]|nr:M18 family aminopeptidase [bacterium]
MISQEQYPQELIRFLEASPTAFHAVVSAGTMLAAAGFQRLHEEDDWGELGPGAYYVSRNDSTIIAFRLAKGAAVCQALRMAGAHTDSPALRVKPHAVHSKSGYVQLGVEIYGGALLAPWFDRDCSLAGRVVWRSTTGQVRTGLLDFRRALVTIPSLAIHLDPEVNKQRSINRQTDMVPILALGDVPDFSSLLLQELQRQHGINMEQAELLDFDLFLYDTQAPALVGLKEEFICSARLDNLLSCHALVQALCGAEAGKDSLIVLNDHEEVGSTSMVGAQGSFLKDVLARLFQPGQVQRIVARSLFVSVDNAHALHPNFSSKYEPEHAPAMHGGPVIKINANQRYATSGVTAALLTLLCREARIPCQKFVMRNDMACGSTIGPLTAAALGLATVDVGVPQLAMHSVRETAAWLDGYSLLRLLQTFFGAADAQLSASAVD